LIIPLFKSWRSGLYSAFSTRRKTEPREFVVWSLGHNRIVWREIGWLRPGLGVGLFALFFAVHPWLFGTRPY